MAVLEVIASVAEKYVTSVVEVVKKGAEGIKKLSDEEMKEIAKKKIEDIKSSGDAVMSKLDDVKNLTPEQLKDVLEVITSVAENSVVEVVKKGTEGIKNLSDEKVKENAKQKIEDIKSSGDAVKSKLDDIKNLTPEQLQEKLNEAIDEYKKLSQDEINEKQKAAIKDTLKRIRNGEKLTNEKLGNLGEMMMDQYYISRGYKTLNKYRVTSLDDKKGGFRTGIDGVYEKANSDGIKSYVIADAKYNTSQLSETKDGKQMSDNWIDKRLDDAVGKEKADEIRDAAEDNPDSVSHEVYHIEPHIDENGSIHTDVQKVDTEGNKVGDKTIVEYFDEDGNRVESSDDIKGGGGMNERYSKG